MYFKRWLFYPTHSLLNFSHNRTPSIRSYLRLVRPNSHRHSRFFGIYTSNWGTLLLLIDDSVMHIGSGLRDVTT